MMLEGIGVAAPALSAAEAATRGTPPSEPASQTRASAAGCSPRSSPMPLEDGGRCADVRHDPTPRPPPKVRLPPILKLAHPSPESIHPVRLLLQPVHLLFLWSLHLCIVQKHVLDVKEKLQRLQLTET